MAKRTIMKYHFIVQLIVVIGLTSLLSAACSAAAPEPTVTPSPTDTLMPPTKTPTPTLQPTATSTLTATVTPSKGVITIKPPANPKDFIYAGGLVSVPLSALTEQQQTKLIENMMNNKPFSRCPEVWIEAVPDSEAPTYALFINASPDDQNKQFAVIIRTSDLNTNVDGSIGMGTISPQTSGKILVAAGYSPVKGQPVPDELEIQLVFPGCELDTEIVKWPA
jgi:hypothetical protein